MRVAETERDRQVSEIGRRWTFLYAVAEAEADVLAARRAANAAVKAAKDHGCSDVAIQGAIRLAEEATEDVRLVDRAAAR